jgi:hypothetical protein
MIAPTLAELALSFRIVGVLRSRDNGAVGLYRCRRF